MSSFSSRYWKPKMHQEGFITSSVTASQSHIETQLCVSWMSFQLKEKMSHFVFLQMSSFFSFLKVLLKCNWFTVLWSFLLNCKVIQWYVYTGFNLQNLLIFFSGLVNIFRKLPPREAVETSGTSWGDCHTLREALWGKFRDLSRFVRAGYSRQTQRRKWCRSSALKK